MKPVDMVPVGTEELMVSWDDGHRSLYRYDELRLQCPCAGCRDEWTGERRITPAQVKTGIHFDDASAVGLYGIRFHWNDGHQTGIYGFEYLRGLCACAACAAGREKGPS